MMEMSEITQI